MKLSCRSTTAAIFLLVSLGSIGCGGPRIETTSINGAVKEITNWEIDWVGDTTVTVDDQARAALGLSSSKYTLPQYCLDYVGEVKRELVQNHDFGFYVNLPAEGILELKIYGQQRALFTQVRTDAGQLMDELNKERADGPVDPFNENTAMVVAESDLVARVDVQILDLNGVVLGEVFVGGEPGDKVKPEDVAKAISEAIRQGGVVIERNPG